MLCYLVNKVCRKRGVEVDGVVAQTLRSFVAFPAPAFKGFSHPYLGPVAILGMVLNPINILKEKDRKTKTLDYLNHNMEYSKFDVMPQEQSSK